MHSSFLPLTHSTHPLISKNIVHLWQLSLASCYQQADYDLLSEAEQQKANRYLYPEHKNRFILCRSQLRRLLADYTTKEPKTIEIDCLAHGKPILKTTEQALEFNVSHSKDIALIAIGHEFSLGVDLECFSFRPYTGIAKHVFSSEEIEHLEQLSNEQQSLYFFKTWTQKEALIKALGFGFSYPSGRMNTSYIDSTGRVYDPIYHTDWKIFSFLLNINCYAALAVHPSIERIYYGQYTPLYSS